MKGSDLPTSSNTILAQALVSRQEALTDLCAKLAKEAYIALDTEFLRVDSFWPRLCLLQIAWGEEVAAVDLLSTDLDLTPLRDLLLSPQIVKIFHASRQDLEGFWHLWQAVPAPLFDTQVAAQLSGLGAQISYQDLVLTLCRAPIDKSARRADWSLRPLPPSLIRYALSDVVWLLDLYHQLSVRLANLNREDWMQEEMQAAVQPERYRQDPSRAWLRHRRDVTRPRDQVLLREIAAWREDLAQRLDKPRGHILKDEALFRLIAQAIRLKKVPPLASFLESMAQPFSETLSEIILQALDMPFDASLRRQTGLAPVYGDLLRLLVEHVSRELDLPVAFLASSDDLEQTLPLFHHASEDLKDYPLLRGWRGATLGKKIRAFQSGRLACILKQGKLEFIPC